MKTNNNTNAQEIKKLATKFHLTEQRISDFICTAMYGNNFFGIVIPEESKKYIKDPDYIDNDSAKVLKKGGVIQILDYDNEFSKAERCEVYGNVVPSFVKEWCTDEDGKPVSYIPMYSLTLERMVQAVQEIQKMDEKTEPGRYLKPNYRNLFIEECGDFCDAYNLLQYFIFGEVVYG